MQEEQAAFIKGFTCAMVLSSLIWLTLGAIVYSVWRFFG